MKRRFQKNYLLAMLLLAISSIAGAQALTGTKNIPGDYSTIGAAVTDLNTNGVGVGGVVFNIAAGYAETLGAPLVVTATGTASAPIVFQKSGVGANPEITSFIGTQLVSSTTTIDIIWSFVGSDFVTISGIDLLESAANTTATTQMEVGYGFYKASATDGANNNTIQNCTVTLNRNNVTASATGPRVNNTGSVGIELMACNPTAVGTIIAATTVAGASSNNRFYSNTIQNVNFGISLGGFAAVSPYTIADQNNDIGGNSASTGNTIINFGGGTGAATQCGAIFINNQWSFNISNNIVNNNTGTGIIHPASNRGIWLLNSSIGASCTIKKNTITISGGTSGSINWCLDVEMSTSGANGNVITIDSNQFLNCNVNFASTVAFTAIWLNTTATTVNVRNNYFYGFSYAGTGTTNVILSQLACGTLNVLNNTIDSTVLSGSAASGTHYHIGIITAVPTDSLNINKNIITRTTLNTIGAGSKGIFPIFTGFSNTAIINMNENTIDSITRNGTTGGTTAAIYIGPGGLSTANIRKNIIRNITITGTGAACTTYGVQAQSKILTCDSNVIRNILCNKVSGTGLLSGFYNLSSSETSTFSNNIISNIRHIGTGNVSGLFAVAGALNNVFSNNVISDLVATGGTVIGINSNGGSPFIHRNKIYNLSSNGLTSGVVSGIFLTSAAANGTINVYYNLISRLYAPFISQTTDAVRGINSAVSLTTTASINVFYNTIVIDSSSTGINFSTSALFFNSNNIASTANLALRNNILKNVAIPSGTGTTVGIRTSAVALDNFNASTNNNLIYVGVPSASRLIYTNGTNSDSTISQYRSRVNPRENSSVSEDIAFASNDPLNANWLAPSSAVPTQAESGGASIAGYLGDFTSQSTRTLFPKTGQLNGGGLAPDIGAYEFDGAILDINGPIISYNAIGNSPVGTSLVLNSFAGITDISLVDTTSTLRPRIYFKKTTDPNDATGWKSAASVNTSSPFSFVINYALLNTPTVSVFDTIQYFIVAQDRLLPTPNVGIQSGDFAAPQTSVNIAGSAFPITGRINQYLITPSLAGTYTVGAGATYSTLTGAGGFFEAVNSGIVTGNVTATIVSDIEEPGTVALNQATESGTGNWRIRITPDAATLRSLTGSMTTAATALFRINGADRVTIDGSFAGSGRFLRFMNRLNLTPTMTFLGDAKRDTLMNCFIEGTNNTVAMLNFGAPATGGSGNDSNVVLNCVFRDTLGTGNNLPTGLNKPNSCIASQSGDATAVNDFITVEGCEFYNFRFNAITISATGGNYWRIYNNAIYNTNDSSFAASVWLNIAGGGGHIIRRNSMGGAAPDRSGPVCRFLSSSTIRLVWLNSTSTIPMTFDSNTIGNIFTQGVFQPSFTNTALMTINNNIVGGAFNPWDTIFSPGTVNGFFISGPVEVNNNIIGNLKSSGSVANGIQTGSGTNLVMNFRNNVVRDIVSLSPTVGYAAQGANGFLVLISTSDRCLVERNLIYNINAVSAKGIVTTSSAVNAITINANRIYNIISNSTTVGGAYAAGIVAFAIGTANFTNNQVSVGTGCNRRVFGFLSTATANTHNVLGNSFFINGAGDSASYGIYIQPASGSSTLNARNNIIYNKRTNTTGTAKHFAAGNNSLGVLNAASLNYNLMIVPDTAFLVNRNFSARGWRGWDTVFTNAGRYNTNWAEQNALIPADSLFIDTAVANLGIVTANSHAWYAHNKGLRISTLTNDYNNTTRSTNITTGAVDIGSVEFTPTSLPPIAFADKTPTANDSTQFIFASRVVAKANWGVLGVLPTAVDVRYYSGVNPANTSAGRTMMNAYWTIAQTGGSGYVYDLSLLQDSAVLGTVANVADLRTARYSGTGNVWTNFPTSAANNVTGLLVANGLTQDGTFTGTDISNNPLPVKLTSFTANVESTDVLVKWTTASEQNNQGFEVERSVDGKVFEQVGFVKGRGNSNEVSTYSLLDIEAFAKTNADMLYYRLKQVDVDGKETYSTIVAVNINTENTNSMSVYPNPFTTDYAISLTATTDAKATVELFNIQGKQVNVQTKNITKGFNVLQVTNIEALHSGIYFVKVTINGEAQIMKLVKN